MDVHDLTAAYALDALDPEEERSYEQHLAGCERCREELASFSEVAGSLALRDASARREAKDRDEAQTLADEVGNKTVVLRLKVGEGDKTFGSITNQDIATGLQQQHRVEVDRHKIDLKEPIKQLGEHQVPLRLHRDVTAPINVIVTQDR